MQHNERQYETKLRLPIETKTRERLRRAAEAGKLLVELKPCQNVTEYELPVSFASQENKRQSLLRFSLVGLSV
jgi:hypothetical protein